MSAPELGRTGGRLLVVAAGVILVDQVCGLSSVIEKWNSGEVASRQMALPLQWSMHGFQISTALLLIVAGFFLEGRPEALRTAGWVAAALAAASVVLVVVLASGYLTLLNTTPILHLGQFQLRVVRVGVTILAVAGWLGSLSSIVLSRHGERERDAIATS